jgi:hypothetical protein
MNTPAPPAAPSPDVQRAASISAPPRLGALSARSALLGFLVVAIICTLTPWNDYVFGNTSLVGNFLPLGLTLILLAVVLGLNGPLRRWRPERALRQGELALVVAMGLVASAIPASGLMRYLPAGIVGLEHSASVNHDQRTFLRSLDLPPALFPRSVPGPIGTYDPAIAEFRGRGDIDQSWLGRVPWRAWVRPAIAWGVLVAALFGGILCLSLIVHRQWAVNERLAFPLAGVYTALIEPAPPRRALNGLFAAPAFWIAAAFVVAIHTTNGLHVYLPSHVPELPLRFDLSGILADEPWNALEPFAKRGAVYFSIIGICYFVQSNVAFSLFAFYLLVQLYRMADPSLPLELGHPAATDQSFGAVLAFAGAMLWVGRHHYAAVARRMLGRGRDGDPRGEFVPYSLAGWGLMASAATAVAWLVWAGAGIGAAILIMAFTLLLLLTVARVVAETGLIFVQLAVPVQQPLVTTAAYGLPGLRAGGGSVFFASLFTGFFTHDARESLSVYASQGLHVNDSAAPPRARRWPIVVMLVLSLAAGYVLAGASTLVAEYSHASTLSEPSVAPLNPYGLESVPANQVLGPSVRYANDQLQVTHERATHIAAGAGITGLLAGLRLRLAWWPLHPIGYLLAYTRPVSVLWFSLFIGWLLKVALLRYGGGGMYRQARPLFIGLIVGEVGAASLWLVVNVIRVAAGADIYPLTIMP